MKHLIYLFIFLLLSTTGYAQNVGIGTTNPAEKLHIQGNLRVEGRSVYFGPDQRIYGDNSSAFYFDGNHATITQLVMRDADNTIYGRLYGGGDGRYFGFLDGDANWSIIADKDVYTGFRIDNSEKMRINANGHVGIGTSSPSGKLTVVVDSAARGLEVRSAYGTTHMPFSNGYTYLAGQGIILRTTSANTERARLTPGGYFGIGVTSPAQRLHTIGNIRADGRAIYLGADQTIYGDDGSAFYFDANHATTSQLILRDVDNTVYGRVYGSGSGRYFGLLDGDGNWSYVADKDVYTGFRINNSEKMRISANGNVGIGTTSSSSRLTLSVDTLSRGLTVLSPNGNSHLPWTNGWSYLSGTGLIFRTNGNSERMRITASGNVGIGTNNPNSKLAVNGNIRSREVLVETANWPDYVFDDNYELPTLHQEADFIKKNGHLSGFESEEAMEGTITVGDVTKRQQEKIEQMMLHLIEMKEGMEAMENGMQKLETEVSELKKENKELKDKLQQE